jgi:hypothetical protein
MLGSRRRRRTIEGSILRSNTRGQLRIRAKSCPLSCRPAGALRLARRSSQESRPHLLRCSDVCLTGIKTQIGRHEQRPCVANPRIAQGRRGHQGRSGSEMLLHLPFSTIVWPATPRTNRSLAAPPSRDCPTVERACDEDGTQGWHSPLHVAFEHGDPVPTNRIAADSAVARCDPHKP